MDQFADTNTLCLVIGEGQIFRRACGDATLMAEGHELNG
jgi:hypothetical protein